MKINLILFCFVLLFSCDQKSNAVMDKEAAKVDIMATISQETECFFARDYECWSSQFLHSDYSFQTWNNSDGTFDAAVGWNKINGNIGKFIKENPEEKEEDGTSSHPVIIRENIQIQFFDDKHAQVTWDQFNSDNSKTFFLHSKELRVVQFEDDVWKIVSVAAFWDYVNQTPFSDKVST